MMNIKEIIQTRKSVRTFDGRPITPEDKDKLCAYIKTIENPYDIPVEFVWLDKDEYGLSSPVITNEAAYIAGKVKRVPHCEEAFGYSFEKFVLFAWSLGIGTTWIGGTMQREMFEKTANTVDDELMPIVTPLGYPAAERAEVDVKLRSVVRGDERLPQSELFYDGDFSTPLTDKDALVLLELVRWAPSAANRQPCRIVKDGNRYHFYERCPVENRSAAAWDVQKIDVGIAICHLMSVTDGQFSISDPGIAIDVETEYIATVTV